MGTTRILVIDDDIQIAAIFQLALNSKGYDAVVANTPRDGMAKACSNPPHLILLDYNLPGKDGISLLNDMRSIPDLAAVPVILVTAVSMPEIVNQAMSSGVVDFLVKPFNLDTLYLRVERAMALAIVDAEN